MHVRLAFITLLALSALVELSLLVSGRRVLVHEIKVSPGEHYVVPEHGDLGASQQASLVCQYFTGRSIVVSVFWYSSNNVLGKDQCPFITTGA